MPSGNITNTPGYTFADEVVTLDKLNSLGAPTSRIDEAAVTERELADGAFTGEKFADGAIGLEKLDADGASDGNYLLNVASGVLSLVAQATATQAPIGVPLPWPSDTAPTGFALMQGQTLTRATYPVLAALYAGLPGLGGDGTTTFLLPDFRDGYFIRGKPAGDSLGDTGGAATHTLTENELPAHDHDVNDVKYDGANSAGEVMFRAWALAGETSEGGAGAFGATGDGGTANPKPSTANAGGGAAHNNLPPYINFNYITRLG